MHLNMRNVSPLRGSRIVSISCARAPHRLHRISAGPLGARSDMASPHRTLSSIVRIVFPELSGSSVTQTLHGPPPKIFAVAQVQHVPGRAEGFLANRC